MSFKAKYVSVRVSGIGKVTKVSVLCKNGIVYEDDVLKAAQEAFAPYGGLVRRPKKRSKPQKRALAPAASSRR